LEGGAAITCYEERCISAAMQACTATLQCGHFCGGVFDEPSSHHLPCLVEDCPGHEAALNLHQTAEETCGICGSEQLSQAPCVQISCGHVFHFSCLQQRIASGWNGKRIDFGHVTCPLCKALIGHPLLNDQLDPHLKLRQVVRKMAAEKLRYEQLERSQSIITPGSEFFHNPVGFAMKHFMFYQCYNCKRPYFAGAADCLRDAAAGDEKFNPVCLSISFYVLTLFPRRTCCVFLVKRLIVSKSVKSMALIGCLSSVGSVARTLFGIAGISGEKNFLK
jgi:E3 ubiquitin-protein ligase MYCBP2